jgi:hypothetical protein
MKIITATSKNPPNIRYFWGRDGWTTNHGYARPSSRDDLVRVNRMLGQNSRFVNVELVEIENELI